LTEFSSLRTARRTDPAAGRPAESDIGAVPPATLHERVRELVGCQHVDELVVDVPRGRELLEGSATCARLAGRSLRVVGAIARSELPAPLDGERWIAEARDGRPTWLLRRRRPCRWRLAVKRAVDVVVAAILLLAALPLLAAAAVAIRLQSPGPVLYAWRVLGRNGRPFTGYKLRTMVADADRRKAELAHLNEMAGPVFKMANDPRVTPIGRWLRRYSIDELPQLWSVVRGDMSLVGPRPCFPGEYERFELWQMRKLSVTPGITCLWQVMGRSAITDFSRWAFLDLQYIDQWSLRLDARILAQTVRAVVRGTGT
jgi:lipopolysaccharide/colanic/teichoic acid biosynthesis glycosyltransferase